jgi:hypothetical protein
LPALATFRSCYPGIRQLGQKPDALLLVQPLNPGKYCSMPRRGNSVGSRANLNRFHFHLVGGYSIFDSALYRSLNFEWFFHQEKATLYVLTRATCESKVL